MFAVTLYGAWARILGADSTELVSDAEEGPASVLDQYGAMNPAEFFAVVTACPAPSAVCGADDLLSAGSGGATVPSQLI